MKHRTIITTASILLLSSQLAFAQCGPGMGKGIEKDHGPDSAFRIITDYMVSHGDMSQEEQQARIETHKQMQAQRQELCNQGDKEAIESWRESHQQLREIHREQFKTYVESHPDLKTELQQRNRSY